MSRPRLLVSVRNASEAIALRESACDIVDVKEPTRGALGMADAAEIRRISTVLPSHQLMSIALGEAADLSVDIEPIDRVSFVKIGLAGLSGDDWHARWSAARSRFLSNAVAWVAVIYADHKLAEAPEPPAIVDAAAATGCEVVLVDTFSKQSGASVFDVLSVSDLQELRRISNASGMQFALAGQLRVQHASQIAEVAPDVVGVRGAACRGSDRRAEIDPKLVNLFASAIAGTGVST